MGRKQGWFLVFGIGCVLLGLVLPLICLNSQRELVVEATVHATEISVVMTDVKVFPTDTLIATRTSTPTLEQTQILTPSQTPTSTSSSTLEVTPTPVVLPTEHVVKKGDTLGEISFLYGVPIGYIALENDISDIDYIYIGQRLTIPDPDQVIKGVNHEGKQIVIVLSLQKVFAYEDGEQIREFVVSTGLPDTPTVLGKYLIYLKYPLTRMTGPGYDLKDVPWTMYFYESYGIHGTYWHNNFGNPMSHGCVNMKIPEAQWLYDWAPIGTNVWVIP